IAFAFGILVPFAPAEPRAKKWTSLGAAIVVTGWIVESLGFKWYVGSIADFRSAVGSLTVVLVFISYLYLASIILLVGIEIDELLRADADEHERTISRLGHRFLGRFRRTGAEHERAGDS